MGFESYNGAVKIAGRMSPSGDYPLMQTCDIQAEENPDGTPGRRLDALLDEIRQIAGVGNGRPIVVESEAEMNAILESATTDNIGMVYKYEGELSETYEIGALYVIENEISSGDEARH